MVKWCTPCSFDGDKKQRVYNMEAKLSTGTGLFGKWWHVYIKYLVLDIFSFFDKEGIANEKWTKPFGGKHNPGKTIIVIELKIFDTPRVSLCQNQNPPINMGYVPFGLCWVSLPQRLPEGLVYLPTFPHLYYPVVFGLDPSFVEGVESTKFGCQRFAFDLVVRKRKMTIWIRKT